MVDNRHILKGSRLVCFNGKEIFVVDSFLHEDFLVSISYITHMLLPVLRYMDNHLRIQLALAIVRPDCYAMLVGCTSGINNTLYSS